MTKATVGEKQKTNEICASCVKWDMFKESCWVHWWGKEFCTQRATNVDEMRELEQFAK